MGVTVTGETPEGHNAGLQRGFRAEHYGEEASRLRPFKPRPEGQDEENRLP